MKPIHRKPEGNICTVSEEFAWEFIEWGQHLTFGFSIKANIVQPMQKADILHFAHKGEFKTV